MALDSAAVADAAGAGRTVSGFLSDVVGFADFLLLDLDGDADFEDDFCDVCFLAACSGELAIRASMAESVTNSRRFKRFSGGLWIRPASNRAGEPAIENDRAVCDDTAR